MRDPSLHDVVTAAPWTVPKKVLPRAAVGDRPFLWGMGHRIMGGNHGENRGKRGFKLLDSGGLLKLSFGSTQILW